jgi:hypothetical protein
MFLNGRYAFILMIHAYSIPFDEAGFTTTMWAYFQDLMTELTFIEPLTLVGDRREENFETIDAINYHV